MSNLFDDLVSKTPVVQPWNNVQLVKDVAGDAEQGVSQGHKQVIQAIDATARMGFGQGEDLTVRLSARTILTGFIVARIQEAADEAIALLEKDGGFEQIVAVVQDLRDQQEAKRRSVPDQLSDLLSALSGDVGVIDLDELFGNQRNPRRDNGHQN